MPDSTLRAASTRYAMSYAAKLRRYLRYAVTRHGAYARLRVCACAIESPRNGVTHVTEHAARVTTRVRRP